MTSYIALLRGINVGGHNLLPMKELTAILTGLGCQNVLTYIQSGNVVFQAAIKDKNIFAGEISTKILENFSFAPKILLLSREELETAIKNNPFDTQSGKILHFFFLDAPPADPDMKKMNALKSASESFQLIESVLYLYTPEGIGRSKLAAGIERCLGVAVTARNWNTIQKLQAMINP